MRRPAIALLALTLAGACSSTKEIDPAEIEAKRLSDLKEAQTRLRNNKVKDAEKIFSRVLKDHPEDHEALAGMAKLRWEQGKFDQAESMLGQSLEIKDDVPEHHALRGKMYQHREQPAEAAKSFGRAFELAPEKSEYGLPYGRALVESEQYAAAEKVLKNVAEIDPMAISGEGSGVNRYLADSLREQGRLDDALKLYMKAQSTYASDRMAHAGAAFIYEAKKKNRLALDQWSSYIRMDCCSDFSNNVAKKKVMELKERPEEYQEEPLPGEAGDEPPPEAG